MGNVSLSYMEIGDIRADGLVGHDMWTKLAYRMHGRKIQ
jgi:hypothetical protein